MIFTIRRYQADDSAAIVAIYNHAILHHNATFEEQPLSAEQMAQRLDEIAAQFPVLVALAGDELIGYAYGNHYKTRSAYRFCAESSVYLDPAHQGRGQGSALYRALLDALAQQGIRQVLAVITSPNPVSETLHQRLGFERRGVLEAVGYKFERWHDVALWQKTLDQRPSKPN
ncbi:N-acetyltransferase family protein [Ferrimonas pelagia]|uniref:GNAT family N-acetyltransferase n=1 Tax=Ferrimonas pelagia TaxID=1177826 RepID=A0ABP9FEX9_9GAMM